MNKIAVVLIHLGYWLMFAILLMSFFFFAVFVPSHVDPAAKSLISAGYWIRLMIGFAVLPGLFTFYGCYVFLFNWYLRSQQYVKFIISSVVAAVIFSALGAALASTPLLFGPAFLFGDGYASALSVLLLMSAVAWTNGVIGTVIKACITWFSEIRLKEELHRKNIEVELALVKSQIDPHFLFNTINNIDVLISRSPAAASAYLNKLSGIMRFVLYETKNDKIALSQEVEYLQQYIDLQKIRTSNSNYVNLQIDGDISGQYIAPMILLPFIENAFKHTESRKMTSLISISLSCHQGRLEFICENTLLDEDDKTAQAGGLGNELTRKRLELLYPKNYKLQIDTTDQLYKVNLGVSL